MFSLFFLPPARYTLHVPGGGEVVILQLRQSDVDLLRPGQLPPVAGVAGVTGLVTLAAGREGELLYVLSPRL